MPTATPPTSGKTTSEPAGQSGPVVLIIRDGWGHNPHPEHHDWNAVELAATPVADQLMTQWPTTLIKTSGEDVGLPRGTMGNSEVGHQNLGAGRIVDQEILRITRTIRDGRFFTNPALAQAFAHAVERGSSVHLLGLVSDGQVHSDLEHLFALIDLAAQQGFPADRLFIHALTDGRDTGPHTGEGFIAATQARLQQTGVGRIASVIGRYYAMDRDHRWERVALAYAALTGRPVVHPALPADLPVKTATNAIAAVREYYRAPSEPSRTGDEFIWPTVITAQGQPIGQIHDHDAVIFFNFRGDRPRQLTRAFTLDDRAWAAVQHGGFARGPRLSDLYFCTLTGYEEGLPVSAVAFAKPAKLPAILGEVVSAAGLSQIRCAETEKYPHVTFFFNDYRDAPFPGENRCLLPSPKDVTTYDQKPEMSAFAVRDAVLERLQAPDCEAFLVVNFANPDMVGHTGNLPAVIRAVEVVDACVGAIVTATLARHGALIVTADHGNAEQTWDPELGCPHTAHTTYDVPLILIANPYRGRRLRANGRLADVAPTVLQLLGLKAPSAMTGCSLLDA